MDCGSKEIVDPKMSVAKKMFGSENILGYKILGKKCLVKKYSGSKEIMAPKIFWFQRKLRSTKILTLKKLWFQKSNIFCIQHNFGPSKNCVQKFHLHVLFCHNVTIAELSRLNLS